MTSPLFEHDCKKCTFLGSFRGADLYFCTQGLPSHPTIIARHSSEPSNYISGIGFARHIPELGEAKRRAIKRGLLE